ncbi:MAG: prepilin-type N-terminal cleavage/methylation domain-containing protein [Myxococcota bacterium]|nr:prepilin-type N-terminal cleavage/methylation domain-containing protein [Myxococcota bacterium]
MRTAPTQRDSRRGITLIEVVVVMALLAVLLLIMVPPLRAVSGANLRQTAKEMATTLRYVYQESVLKNVPMRVAYDLDNGTWWVEAADGDAVIFRNRTEREAFTEFLAVKAEADERVQKEAEMRRATAPDQQQLLQQIFGDSGGEEGMPGGMNLLGGLLGGAGISPVNRGGEFQPNEFRPLSGDETEVIGEIFTPRILGANVRFLGIWTPQYEETVRPMDEFEYEAMLQEPEEEQTWTVAYTHAFPGGYLEDSVIYLTDDDNSTVISLTVDPLLGQVTMVYDEVDPPDLRDREQRQ